jgi:hypothetical protein
MQLEKERKRDVKIKQSYKQVTVWLQELCQSNVVWKFSIYKWRH